MIIKTKVYKVDGETRVGAWDMEGRYLTDYTTHSQLSVKQAKEALVVHYATK